MLVLDNLKLIQDLDDEFLFDLENDPGEQTDLSLTHLDQLEAMQSAAADLRRSVVIKPTLAPEIEEQLAPEVEESLRKLGYIE
jgi:hypothetical protein